MKTSPCHGAVRASESLQLRRRCCGGKVGLLLAATVLSLSCASVARANPSYITLTIPNCPGSANDIEFQLRQLNGDTLTISSITLPKNATQTPAQTATLTASGGNYNFSDNWSDTGGSASGSFTVTFKETGPIALAAVRGTYTLNSVSVGGGFNERKGGYSWSTPDETSTLVLLGLMAIALPALRSRVAGC